MIHRFRGINDSLPLVRSENIDPYHRLLFLLLSHVSFFSFTLTGKRRFRGLYSMFVFGACCPNPSIQIDLNAQH